MVNDLILKLPAIRLVTLRSLSLILISIFLFTFSFSSQTVQAQGITLTVNSTNDPGDGVCDVQNCTLREAITAANATITNDTIVFNLSGTTPYIIQPLLPLPWITSPVTIDGTSQPGYAGSPLIVVNGDLVPPAPQGQEPTRVGINIISGNSTVRGLVVNGWDYGGIGIINGNGNTITGNYVGTDASGSTAVPNLYGVIIYQSSNNLIGGTTSASSNTISGNLDDGVNIGGASAQNNKVLGNIIGLTVTGNSPLGNGDDGVKIEDAQSSLIGDTTVGSRNIIASNTHNGVIIKGTAAIGTQITNNYIGTDPSGSVAHNNGLYGVALEGASSAVVSKNLISGSVSMYSGASGNALYGNTIGMNAAGTATLGATINGIIIDNANNNIIGDVANGSPNLISGASQNGITVTGTSIKNRISGNRIFGNSGLGIDLGDDGVTVNDSNDTDNGPNNLQNYPTLIVVRTWQGQVYVRGSLQGASGATYRLEFFKNDVCDSSGYGQGQTFFASHPVTISPTGDGSFNFQVTYDLPANTPITATAIDPANNTSEFSACMTADAQPILPPAAPTPITPTNNTFTNIATPLFTWNTSVNATGYDIEVDNNSDFSSVEQSQSLTGLSYQATTLSDGLYYWHIRSTNAAGNGQWSATEHFTVDTLAPASPVLSTPTDNLVTTNSRPHFSWTVVAGIDHYVFTIGHSIPTVKPVYSGPLTTYVPVNDLVAGIYYWQVAAVDAAGNFSTIIETRTLTIQSLNNAAPPLNYFTVNTPILTWNRVNSATIYKIEVDSSPMFNTPLDFSATVPAQEQYVFVSALDNGTYYWHVKACSSENTCGLWSSTQSFIIDTP